MKKRETSILARKDEIIQAFVGIDYEQYNTGLVSFDYEGLLEDSDYTLEDIIRVQSRTAVGRTPFLELKNITELIRSFSSRGKGARIFVKDEASNPTGSIHDRQAAILVSEAKKLGFKGVITISDNRYGPSIAAQAAKVGMSTIIIMPSLSASGVEHPELRANCRLCENYGAEVIRTTIGDEHFTTFLTLLERTGYFNVSPFIPWSLHGLETVGYEIALDSYLHEGRYPDALIIPHSSGLSVSATTRGLRRAGALNTQIIATSVDSTGLDRFSHDDYSRILFISNHTGKSIHFTTRPNSCDVPFNCGRTLRYIDRFVSISSGEVLYATQLLTELEGIERGITGNIALGAAFAIAAEMDRDQIVVIENTHSPTTGNHPLTNLNYAKDLGIEVFRGDPADTVPRKNLIIPEKVSQFKVQEIPLDPLRHEYLKNTVNTIRFNELTDADLTFLSEETRYTSDTIKEILTKKDKSIA